MVKTLFKKKRITGIFEIGKVHSKFAILEEDLKGNKTIQSVKEAGLEALTQDASLDDLIVILSRNQVTVRNLELPTTDPQEIKDIISIQAGKQTPFSKDEIIADFKTIGLSRQHYTKVLLAIVQKAIVNNFLNNLAEK